MNAYHIAKNLLNKHKISLNLYSEMNYIHNKIKNNQNKSAKKNLIIAIKHLHNRHIETSLATIYDLEKIALNHPQFHWEIMKNLTDFVQNYAPYIRQTGNKPHPSPTICTDIQAALTVIARRDVKKDPENEQVDLSHTDITGANLCGANLEKINLYQTNLCGADLRGANLSGAILSSANLTGANLSGANLKEAILSAANLKDANLSRANLHRANLYLAKMHGAILNDAILNQANLRECQFSGLDTLDTKLRDA
jgi:hypothetical protein